MKRLVLASCAALLILAPVVAFAQSRTPPAGSSTVGSAAPRGGESTGSSSSSSSGTATERGGGASGGAGGSFSSPVGGGASVRGNYDGPRSGDPMPSARPRNASASVGQAVPASERPRGDGPVYGHAVPRSQAVQNNQQTGIGTGYYPYYYDYYGSYGWYGSYGNYWNPWNPWAPWSSINPYTWGPYGWSMWPMSMYSSYWYDYASSVGPAVYTSSTTGSIKLKVKPKEAEVYVDGTYYGQVDNYDGTFQHLDLSAGTHRVEIRASGYQTLQVEVRVLPGKTITYNGELKPAK